MVFHFLFSLVPERPLIRGEPFNIESFHGQSVTVAVGGTLKVLQETTVNIRCVASGKPVPSVFWNSTGDMQPANKYDIKQEGTLLTIREVDTRDSGKYMCNAVNKAGKDSQAAVLEVVGKIHLDLISSAPLIVSLLKFSVVLNLDTILVAMGFLFNCMKLLPNFLPASGQEIISKNAGLLLVIVKRKCRPKFKQVSERYLS